MPSFIVTHEGKNVQVFDLQEAKVTIGRKGPTGPDRLVLEDVTVSSSHAIVERHGNQYMVQDLHSRNGVMLNGKLIPSGRLYPIAFGDKIQVCDFVLELSADAASAAPAQPPPAASPSTAQPSPPAPPEGGDHPEGLPSELGGMAFKRVYTPRDVVGGDFFVSRRLDASRLALGIGDATGGGDPVVEVTLRCTDQARRLSAQNTAPREAIASFHRELGSTHPGRKVTFLYGILDTEEGTFHFANAGHAPPLFFNRDHPAKVRKLLTQGEELIGGSGSVAPDAWEERRVALDVGDTIVLLTDGFIHATPGRTHDMDLDLKNRIREVLTRHWGADLARFLDEMKGKISEVENAIAPFGFEGVARAIASHGGTGVRKLLPAIEEELREYLRGGDPGDDLTLIGFERLR